jgi:WD40 repeat protein
LVEGEKTPRVKVREIGTGKIKASFPLPGSAKVRFNGHDFWDYKVGFSHDGETLFLGTGGGFVHRWELASGNELPALHAHAGTVTGLHSLPDGKTLITTGADGLIRFWDEKAGKPLLEMDGYQGQVHSAYSPDGRVIAVGDGLGRLHLWDAATGKRLRILREDGPAVLALAFAANGKTLAARLPKGEIRFWQMPSGQEGEAVHEQIPPGTESPQPLHLRPDGRHFDVSRIDHRVWSWEAGGTTFSHRGVDCASALSPDGRTLITAGRGPYLKVFNTDTGRPRLQFKLNSPAKDFEWDVVRALAFAPDGRRLAVALDDGEISICDPRTGAEVKRCVDEKGPGIGFQKFRDRPVWPDPITLAFSADGKWLASGSRFGPVRVWEVATGKVIRCLQGHEGEVLHVAFGPDGRTLLSSDNDGQAYLWDVRPSDLGGGGRPPDDLWRDLVGGDAVAAFAAVWEISEREDVGRDLRQRILPVKPVTKNRAAKPISALIADLNSEKFRVRDEATEDLAALGERAVAALTEALKKRPGLEVERRIQKLLDALRRGPTPEELRQMRAVQALELADTPEARAVLREWAGGAPGARLTEDARAALARLRERNVSGRRVP